MTALNRAASQMLAPLQLLPPKVDTGTTGTGVDVTAYEGIGIVTLLTGAQGTSGVLKVLIEDSADNSSWATLASFGASGYTDNTTGANQVLSYAIDLDGCRKYVRATSSVVSGTSLILGASLHGAKKVSG